MQIVKRNGNRETVKLEKISARIRKLTYELNPKFVDYNEVAVRTVQGLYDGVSTSEIDTLAAETAASLTGHHPDYSILAARIALTALHKETPATFSEAMEKLDNFVNKETGEQCSILNPDFIATVRKNAAALNAMVVDDRDFKIKYFGFKTLERSYLKKINEKVVERPQYMYMRVAVGIWGDDLENVQKTYDLLSQGYLSHATPTMFNAGTKLGNYNSCFLTANKGDDIHNLFETISDLAKMSKVAGGLGLHIHDVRAKGSFIRGTNGKSDGVIPYMRTLSEVTAWINQGGMRKGSMAVYLEPWHADIFDFVQAKNPTGAEEMRARNLFLAVWTPDLFMKRVEEDGNWSLFCPNECPGLSDVYDDGMENKFTKLYEQYEREGKARRVVKARDLMSHIIKNQIESGVPYLSFKDSVNRKNNQSNLGTIKSSNLCHETLLYSSYDEVGVCVLASMCLPKYVDRKAKKFNYEKLGEDVRQAARNLNRIIDVSTYPTKETRNSNLLRRPVGIGVQGLADVFALLKISPESPKAREINQCIYETIYYHSIDESANLARNEGSYTGFEGSPASEGILQPDMWNVTPLTDYNWQGLREKVKGGLRNSLSTCQMPTASSASILDNNEAAEFFTNNFGKRKILAGEYIIVNRHLIHELCELGLWNETTRLKLIEADGSIQNIEEIPADVRARYKTAWELPVKLTIDMAADRGAFICQSQSMNLFIAGVNAAKLNSAHFYGWKKGLKTGMYYLRTQKKASTMKTLGVDLTALRDKVPEVEKDGVACSLDNPGACESCSS